MFSTHKIYRLARYASAVLVLVIEIHTFFQHTISIETSRHGHNGDGLRHVLPTRSSMSKINSACSRLYSRDSLIRASAGTFRRTRASRGWTRRRWVETTADSKRFGTTVHSEHKLHPFIATRRTIYRLVTPTRGGGGNNKKLFVLIKHALAMSDCIFVDSTPLCTKRETLVVASVNDNTKKIDTTRTIPGETTSYGDNATYTRNKKPLNSFVTHKRHGSSSVDLRAVSSFGAAP